MAFYGSNESLGMKWTVETNKSVYLIFCFVYDKRNDVAPLSNVIVTRNLRFSDMTFSFGLRFETFHVLCTRAIARPCSTLFGSLVRSDFVSARLRCCLKRYTFVSRQMHLQIFFAFIDKALSVRRHHRRRFVLIIIQLISSDCHSICSHVLRFLDGGNDWATKLRCVEVNLT